MSKNCGKKSKSMLSDRTWDKLPVTLFGSDVASYFQSNSSLKLLKYVDAQKVHVVEVKIKVTEKNQAQIPNVF